MTKLEILLMAALRLLRNNYRPWATSGGSDECDHGIMRHIACKVCDEELVSPFLYFREQLPKPDEMSPTAGHPHKWEPHKWENPTVPESTVEHQVYTENMALLKKDKPLKMVRPFDHESSNYNMETIGLSIEAEEEANKIKSADATTYGSLFGGSRRP